MTTADELAALAGGDEHELAVQEIRRDVLDARQRLLEAHPLFAERTPT